VLVVELDELVVVDVERELVDVLAVRELSVEEEVGRV
jgi:hypothetical protein